MSVLTDEDTIVLESLDFEVPCSWRHAVAHPAEKSLSCRNCGDVRFSCATHIAEADMVLATRPVMLTCTTCRAQARSVSGLYLVVPL